MTLRLDHERITADAGVNIEAALNILENAFDLTHDNGTRIADALCAIGYALTAQVLVSMNHGQIEEFITKYDPITPMEE
jgi:hypothetical protein